MAPGILLDDNFVSAEVDYSELKKQRSVSPLEGWPVHLDAAFAWSGKDFQHEDQFTYSLTDQEQFEVRTALKNFKDLGLEGQEVNKSNFPLPTFQHRLHALSKELHKGKGFFVLRGIKPCGYTIEDNIIMYLGVSSYIGEKRGKQDHMGNMLIHIRNATKMQMSQQTRPAMDSKLSLAFHADLWTDILALQTLGVAAEGGNHILAPTYTIYNELASTRPELLEALVKPDWLFDPRSLHYTTVRRPLVSYHDGRVIFNFARLHSFGDDPSKVLTPLQLEALTLLQDIARQHQLTLKLQTGDLCFMNNFAILHSRDAFEDSLQNTRHLVRLFLKNEEMAWKLPAHLARGNDKMFYDWILEERWEIFPHERLGFDPREKFSP